MPRGGSGQISPHLHLLWSHQALHLPRLILRVDSVPPQDLLGFAGVTCTAVKRPGPGLKETSSFPGKKYESRELSLFLGTLLPSNSLQEMPQRYVPNGLPQT